MPNFASSSCLWCCLDFQQSGGDDQLFVSGQRTSHCVCRSQIEARHFRALFKPWFPNGLLSVNTAFPLNRWTWPHLEIFLVFEFPEKAIPSQVFNLDSEESFKPFFSQCFVIHIVWVRSVVSVSVSAMRCVVFCCHSVFGPSNDHEKPGAQCSFCSKFWSLFDFADPCPGVASGKKSADADVKQFTMKSLFCTSMHSRPTNVKAKLPNNEAVCWAQLCQDRPQLKKKSLQTFESLRRISIFHAAN